MAWVNRGLIGQLLICSVAFRPNGLCLAHTKPELASPLMLTCTLAGQSNVSLEKLMLKLNVALQDELLHTALSCAMLACHILISLKTRERNAKSLLRLSDD